MEKTLPTDGTHDSIAAANSSPNLNSNPIQSQADWTWRSTGRGSGRGGRGVKRPHLEGVLSKYTNLIQGWQNRYFVLDEELNQLQYFVSEQGRGQKPRGTLPLIGASITVSDEAPHMFVINSANGELFKLRAVDGVQQQLWMSHLQSCTTESSVRTLRDTDEQQGINRTTLSSVDTQGSSHWNVSLLPSASSSSSSSPRLQRHLPHCHRSPAAQHHAKLTHPDTLLEVKEVITQAECQQKSLIHSIELLPRRGGVSCLDQDLLLLKATSAATLHCLTQCLSILQQHRHTLNMSDSSQQQAPPSEECTMDSVETVCFSEHQQNSC